MEKSVKWWKCGTEQGKELKNEGNVTYKVSMKINLQWKNASINKLININEW